MKRSKTIALVSLGTLALAGCGDSQQSREAECRRFEDTQFYNECKEGKIRVTSGQQNGSVYYHSYLPLPYPIAVPPTTYYSGSRSFVNSARNVPVINAARTTATTLPATAVTRGGFGGSAVSSASS